MYHQGKEGTMAPPPGRLGSTVKMPVQVRMLPAEIAAVDAFAAALSQQSYGAAFSRAEALRIAAMEWLKDRQARGTPAPSQRAPAAAPALEAEAHVHHWQDVLALGSQGHAALP